MLRTVAVAATVWLFAFVGTADARTRWQVVKPYHAKLIRIAWCESRLHWHINTGNGYYGGLQFTLGTWRTVGGRGMPHLATPLEQKYRAVKLFKLRGSWSDWPICGLR